MQNDTRQKPAVVIKKTDHRGLVDQNIYSN